MIKKLLFFFLLFACQSFAQDIGVVDISLPVSGCSLSSASSVRVLVFNYGPDINSNFDITYRINGGAPVTETVPLIPPFFTGSTYNYTFNIKADLSTPGTYVIDAYTSFPGDVNTANDTLKGYTVVSDALSAGGTVIGGTSVCSTSNGGTLTLTGYTGKILKWEYSINGGSSWTNIADTLNTYNYSNLSTITMFRAFVQNKSCPGTYSDTALINIDSPSVGGSVSGGATVCPGATGTLTLNGFTGTIVQWQSSMNGGGVWNSIANTTSSQAYNNPPDTILYRAEVKNGSCPSTFSTPAAINVKAASSGGTLAGADTVCSGLNSGTLTLSGFTGNILNWEYSTDNGISWNLISNTAPVYTYTDLPGKTLFRVKVQNCPPFAYSNQIEISVDQPSLGGNIAKDTTICKGTGGALQLTGYSGSILFWESSTNNGSSWTKINNTTPVQNFTNLLTPVLYRARVKTGTCPAELSDTARVDLFTHVINAGPDVSIDLGKGVTLNASGGSNYSWSPGSGLSDPAAASPVANPLLSTAYFLSGIDSFGCSDIDTVVVNVIAHYDFVIPNLITPNGDSFNDSWQIEKIENYINSEVFIYNDGGMEVFTAAPYLNDWPGESRVTDGTYFYVLRFKDAEPVFKGSITVIGGKK